MNSESTALLWQRAAEVMLTCGCAFCTRSRLLIGQLDRSLLTDFDAVMKAPAETREVQARALFMAPGEDEADLEQVVRTCPCGFCRAVIDLAGQPADGAMRQMRLMLDDLATSDEATLARIRALASAHKGN